METIHESITKSDRKLVKLSAEAHEALKVLVKLEREENNGFSGSYVELASNAIIEMKERKERAKRRRLAHLAELNRNTRRAKRAGVTA